MAFFLLYDSKTNNSHPLLLYFDPKELTSLPHFVLHFILSSSLLHPTQISSTQGLHFTSSTSIWGKTLKFCSILESCRWLRFVCSSLIWWCMMNIWFVSIDWTWGFLVWVGKLIKNSKRNSNRIVENWNLRTYPYGELYGFICRHQNLMKTFLYETRHLELSNHINNKALAL